MKKCVSAVLAAVMILSAAVVGVGAESHNPSGGLKTDVVILKASPECVVKDGVIGENEYERLNIVKDPDRTDLLFSWNGSSDRLYENCREFLKTVDLYFSWDEVHGLNFAAKCHPIETPVQLNEQQPGTSPYDEFLFQLGMMLRIYGTDGASHPEIFYRGFSRRTDDGSYLVGNYGENGYGGTLDSCKAERDFVVNYLDDGTVIYEISVDPKLIFKGDQLENGQPKDGVKTYFEITLTAGSEGLLNRGNTTYAVSLGDGGFLSDNSAPNGRIAEGTISYQPLHEHVYDRKGYNSTSHWDECYCGARSNVKGHVEDKSKAIGTVPPGELTEGYTEYRCTGCDFRFRDDFTSPTKKVWNVFSDVKESSWFADAVTFVTSRGMMNGKGGGKFAPNDSMTRAELVTVLWRLEGEKDAGACPFTDLKAAWYKKAVAWAYENGVVNGTGARTFSPDSPLTREQIATILMRYAEMNGDGVSERGRLENFFDFLLVHDWARDAMSWASAVGLIEGTVNANGRRLLSPRKNATRAEVATMLRRFCEE
ncbi:MAG: S-layer homology domain-containing protein [Clostridia bacterium]|nr:S-layer homology domain-containing protein [Clostridia bacterium]